MGSMVAAGANAVRINLVHGGHQAHDELVQTYRSVCSEMGCTPVICADVQGTELRTSHLVDPDSMSPVDAIELRGGETVAVFGMDAQDADKFIGWRSATGGSANGTAARIGISTAKLVELVQPGTTVRLGDGSVELTVASVQADAVTAKVVRDCKLGSHKPAHIHGAAGSGAFLQAAGREDIAWAVRSNVDCLLVPLQSVEECQALEALLAELRASANLQYAALFATFVTHYGL